MEQFSDKVDYDYEKLESWHRGLETDSQRVTWTAFAILSVFFSERDLSQNNYVWTNLIFLIVRRCGKTNFGWRGPCFPTLKICGWHLLILATIWNILKMTVESISINLFPTNYRLKKDAIVQIKSKLRGAKFFWFFCDMDPLNKIIYSILSCPTRPSSTFITS